MTDIIDLKNTIDLLEKQIKEHDESYYGKESPTISDPEYDQLIVQLRELRKEFPNPSVLDKPGYGSSNGRPEVKHLRPMISLRTEVDTSIKPIEEFIKRVKAVNPDPVFVAEMKYDGLAISLRYENCILTDAVLRGDGETGESVLDNVQHIKNIPSTILLSNGVDEVRGEVVLLKDQFDALNAKRIQEKGKPYVNPRNAVAGMMRATDTSITDIKNSVIFVPYAVFGHQGITSQSEALHWLRETFKDKRLDYPLSNAKTADVLMAYYGFIEAEREDILFEIDGMVYKVDDFETQQKLGSTGREPNWAIAHKFIPEEAVTTLEAIDVQVGPSGRLTPVARIKPVFVGGTTVSNVTLSNVFQIRKKKVRVGDEIVVRRAGDVIPEIAGIAPTNDRTEYRPNFKMIDHCPSCGHPVKRPQGQANYICEFYDCPAQVAGKFTHIARRDVLNIDGLGPSIAETLQASGLTKISELLRYTGSDFIRAGVGRADSLKIASELVRTRTQVIPLDRVFRALAIPGIGESASKALSSFYKTAGSFLTSGRQSVEYVKGLNVNNIRDLKEFLTDNLQEAFAIMSSFNIGVIKSSDGPLTGSVVVVTGSHPEYHRSDIKEMVESLGGTTASGVNGKCSLLVFGDGAGSNLEKAKKLGVPVMTIIEFLDKYKGIK